MPNNFTRKNLEAMGLEKDVIDKLCDMHTDDLNDILQREKESKANDTKLTQALDDLKQQFETYKQQESEKAARAAKATAVKNALKSAGISAKYIDNIARLTDLDGIEIDGGKVKDADAFITNAKSEWADFVEKTHEQGANVAHPPKPSDGGKVMTPEKITEIKDAGKRQAAWSDYLENEGKDE